MHYLAYPIIIISLIIQRNLETKIQAKWKSGLTTEWLKQDPPVLAYHCILVYNSIYYFTDTGGSHLSHTVVKPDSHLTQIFC